MDLADKETDGGLSNAVLFKGTGDLTKNPRDWTLAIT
jgi:hypothetical protein